jgi:hypothetical protein
MLYVPVKALEHILYIGFDKLSEKKLKKTLLSVYAKSFSAVKARI